MTLTATVIGSDWFGGTTLGSSAWNGPSVARYIPPLRVIGFEPFWSPTDQNMVTDWTPAGAVIVAEITDVLN